MSADWRVTDITAVHTDGELSRVCNNEIKQVALYNTNPFIVVEMIIRLNAAADEGVKVQVIMFIAGNSW